MKRTPFNQTLWTGKSENEDGILGLRIHQVIQDYSNFSDSTIQPKVIIGIYSSENKQENHSIFEIPANSIRKSLANLPVLFSNHNFIFDTGNIIYDKNSLNIAQENQIIDQILSANHFPIILSENRDISTEHFLALAKFHENLGFINISANLNLKTYDAIPKKSFHDIFTHSKNNNLKLNYFSIGIQETRNTKASFKQAEELNADFITADEVHLNLNQILDKLNEITQHCEVLYISLDMNAFDLSYAPGAITGTTNGLTPFQVKYILKFLMKSKKVKLFELVGYNPSKDLNSMTSELAGQMIFEILRS